MSSPDGAYRLKQFNLSADHLILLACARGELSTLHIEQIEQACAGGVRWGDVTGLADAHGVGYFVRQHLFRIGADSKTLRLPEAIQSQWQKDRWGQSVHGQNLLECQFRLQEAFSRAGVATIWLKGLALSEQLYGCPEARGSGDLDMLVEPSQAQAAEECLSRLALQLDHAAVDDHTLARHQRRWQGQMIAENTLLVELHVGLGGPRACQPDIPGLMQRSRTVSLKGQPFRVLSIEDELLFLCLHAHRHNYAILRCLMDVAEYVKRYGKELNAESLLERAKRYRCVGRMKAGLILAHRALDLKPEAAVLQFLPELTRRQLWALRKLSLEALLDRTAEQDDYRRARLAFLMDRISDVVRLLGPHLFPTRDYVRAICPSPWRRVPAFAYFYHLLRVTARILQQRS